MSTRQACAFVAPLVLASLATTLLLAQSAHENAADAERLIKVLDIHAGSVVGEIGAGDGALTIAMAKAVGDSGRVFSNELNKERLSGIGKAAESAGLKSVTTVEGRVAETNLGERCCDAIFMRSVYHHFADPAAMNASLFKSLKPGGRLAVQDFGPPPGAESPTPAGRSEDGHHGVTAPRSNESSRLQARGLSATQFGRRGVLVVARRPAPRQWHRAPGPRFGRRHRGARRLAGDLSKALMR
jgi:ubiquinone/menaquinone biosynthesis C-methylase UbiE